ncbi:MAG TPA: prolyl oligopeptidase family serine peptidase [Burkholderiales bacterium]|nr:prolyl oligopeptidase family serine peptidase [Burkholderiales bacterium]
MRFWAVELFFLFGFGSAVAADRLPAYGADVAAFTVSGVSSGGYMAVQVQVAHSSRVHGVGALAAGPYYCARGSLWTAWGQCMSGAPAVSRSDPDRYAREKRIDPVANIAKARVWLFSGTQDRTVVPAVVDALARQYTLLGAQPVTVRHKPAGHAMVTENAGNACAVTEPPFINDCDYDAAGELLRHLLGALSPPPKSADGRLIAFDQRELGGTSAISMAAEGFVYVPRVCGTERCRVHVAFHGCRQGVEAVDEQFVRNAGYNRWADTNRLIVLYPQVAARYWWWPFNPRGCWDWWGYTGPAYATKEGPQIRAVMAMVERLGAKRRP